MDNSRMPAVVLNGMLPEDIARILGIPVEEVRKIDRAPKHPSAKRNPDVYSAEENSTHSE